MHDCFNALAPLRLAKSFVSIAEDSCKRLVGIERRAELAQVSNAGPAECVCFDRYSGRSGAKPNRSRLGYSGAPYVGLTSTVSNSAPLRLIGHGTIPP